MRHFWTLTGKVAEAFNIKSLIDLSMYSIFKQLIRIKQTNMNNASRKCANLQFNFKFAQI